jgi:hypothetical protein
VTEFEGPRPGPKPSCCANGQDISAVSLGIVKNFRDATGAPIGDISSDRLPNFDEQQVHDSSINNFDYPQFDTSAGNRYFEDSGLGSMSVQQWLALPPGQRPAPVCRTSTDRARAGAT